MKNRTKKEYEEYWDNFDWKLLEELKKRKELYKAKLN